MRKAAMVQVLPATAVMTQQLVLAASESSRDLALFGKSKLTAANFSCPSA